MAAHIEIDYHVHTKASHDGAGTVEEYCLKADALGFKEIAFTNHLDFDPAWPHAMFYDHAAFLDELKAEAAKHRGLTLRAGVEASYQTEFKTEIARYLDSVEVDFVMGSVHSVGSADNTISEEEGAQNYFRDKMSPKDAYAAYFDLVLESVRFGHFDVVGHLDIVKRYGSSIVGQLDYREHYGVLRRIVEAMIKWDMSLEVNSAGLCSHAREIYPSPDILKMYHEFGGRRLTVGSDAHRPDDLGRGFDQVASHISRAGFGEITVYEKRAPRQVKLP